MRGMPQAVRSDSSHLPPPSSIPLYTPVKASEASISILCTENFQYLDRIIIDNSSCYSFSEDRKSPYNETILSTLAASWRGCLFSHTHIGRLPPLGHAPTALRPGKTGPKGGR